MANIELKNKLKFWKKLMNIEPIDMLNKNIKKVDVLNFYSKILTVFEQYDEKDFKFTPGDENMMLCILKNIGCLINNEVYSHPEKEFYGESLSDKFRFKHRKFYTGETLYPYAHGEIEITGNEIEIPEYILSSFTYKRPFNEFMNGVKECMGTKDTKTVNAENIGAVWLKAYRKNMQNKNEKTLNM